jgi:methyl-accepting chemotaxis protein
MDGDLTSQQRVQNQSNLAAAESATKPDAPAERVRTHFLDRLTTAGAVGGTALLLILLAFGGDALASLDAGGHLLWWLGVLVAVAIASGAMVFRVIISPIVGEQLRGLADVAEAIAAGDLTRTPDAARAGGQLGRLGRAMIEMTDTLRRLAKVLRDNSTETATRATEITASTEHMAEAASGIAETASTLSLQSSTMADTIKLLAADASRLSALASSLSSGAAEGIERNKKLKSLATENHDLLNESARKLDALVTDVQASAAAARSLATASDQILGFVALVRKIARQSKLLALNAAMEASRAGEHGEGFTVVANEVRRLAASTTEAAEHTDQLMRELVTQMETAREASTRSLSAVETVRSATARGEAAFTQIERAVGDADKWVSTMASSAAAGNAFAEEITTKIGGLSDGTTAFANSMQDVAAASEEQSASTEEIAAAATALVKAADRVSGTAANFRRGEHPAPRSR